MLLKVLSALPSASAASTTSAEAAKVDEGGDQHESQTSADATTAVGEKKRSKPLTLGITPVHQVS